MKNMKKRKQMHIQYGSKRDTCVREKGNTYLCSCCHPRYYIEILTENYFYMIIEFRIKNDLYLPGRHRRLSQKDFNSREEDAAQLFWSE